VSPLWKRDGRPGRGSVPPSGVLRRERRSLLELREQRLRDLGGLLLEMFRRNQFREELVRERCEDLLELDDRLAELDTMLGLVWTLPEALRCACGAPLAVGSRFCASCGRAVGDVEEAEARCLACGQALAAEAAFCVRCGARAGTVKTREDEISREEQAAVEPAEQ
jgi:hypothetical protein